MKKELKPKILAQLNRAEGMLKKVVQMVEDDRYCIDVLQQSLAVIGFAKAANKLLLENHLDTCFKISMKNSSPKKEKEMIGELLRIVNKI